MSPCEVDCFLYNICYMFIHFLMFLLFAYVVFFVFFIIVDCFVLEGISQKC